VLVWADDDSEAPIAGAEKVSAATAGSTLVRCPGAGHLTPLTAPHELRQAVERLLGPVT
jgi:pimeloyl-ACP methyl ester carboxylesterase